MIKLPNNWRVVRYRQVGQEHFAYMAMPKSKLVTIRAFSLDALNQSVIDYAEKHKRAIKKTIPEYEWFKNASVGDKTTVDCIKKIENLRNFVTYYGGKIETYSFMQLGVRKWRVTVIAK